VPPARVVNDARGQRPSLDSPLGLLGLSKSKPPGAVARVLLDAAPKTRCPNTYGLFIVSAEIARAYPLTCGRWDCPAPGCGGLKAAGAKEVFIGGYDLARERGERVRLMTLTSLPGTTLPDFQRGLNRVLGVLRAKGLLSEYGGAIERTKTGLPHAHLMVTGGYIEQALLSRWAYGGPTCTTRLGEVVDIRAVRDTGPRSAVAGYLLKDQSGGELARYVSKAATEQARAVRAVEGIKRHRPIRLSRGWYPGGQAAAERVVKSRWSDGAQPVTATDWTLLRLDPVTDRVIVVAPPKTPKPAVDISGYRVVTETETVLLRAA
jgi:hypothetical protein